MGQYTLELPDGRVIYRASALGSCPNALYLDRLGVVGEPTPDWLQVRFDQGKAGEEPILDALYQDMDCKLLLGEELEQQGYTLGTGEYIAQVQVWVRITDKVWVRGHTDGVGYWLGNKRGIEVKLFGEALWKQYQRGGLAAFPRYQMQVAAYMKGLGLPYLFVVGLRDDNGDLVVKDGKAVIDVREIDDLPVPWSQVMGKVLGIEGRLAKSLPPPCHKPYDYPCPYYQLHDEDDAVGIPSTDVLLVDSLAAEHERHKRLKEEHEEKQKNIAKTLAKYFDDKGIGSPVPEEGIRNTNCKFNGTAFDITDVRYWRKGFVSEDRLKEGGINPDEYRQPGGGSPIPKDHTTKDWWRKGRIVIG